MPGLPDSGVAAELLPQRAADGLALAGTLPRSAPTGSCFDGSAVSPVLPQQLLSQAEALFGWSNDGTGDRDIASGNKVAMIIAAAMVAG